MKPLSQLDKSPYVNTSQLKTLVARIQTVFYDEVAVIKSVIELPNLSPVDYRYNASFNGSLVCESKGKSYIKYVACSFGSVMEINCPGNDTCTVLYTCPEVREEPQCLIRSGLGFMPDKYCSVQSYTSKSTTCECGQLTIHRRLSNISNIPLEQEIGASIK